MKKNKKAVCSICEKIFSPEESKKKYGDAYWIYACCSSRCNVERVSIQTPPTGNSDRIQELEEKVEKLVDALITLIEGQYTRLPLISSKRISAELKKLTK